MDKGMPEWVGVLIALAAVGFVLLIVRKYRSEVQEIEKTGPGPVVTDDTMRAAAAADARNPLVAQPEQDWRVQAQAREEVRPTQPVRVAMGPIIGAILIANLITGVIGAIIYALTK